MVSIDSIYHFLTEEERHVLISLFQMVVGNSIIRAMSVAEFARVFLPPIAFEQYATLFRQERMVGFCSWALLSDEAELAFVNASRNLEMGDWRSGQRVWIMDFIAERGADLSLARVVRKRIPGALGYEPTKVRIARRDERGKIRRLIDYR